jgi:solute:Na+ symporter, SSS family
MLKSLEWFDIVVVIAVLSFLVLASMYSSFKKKNAEDYFMAGRSLRWWSVAGSIFGTNIHAQQIIGMMGVGYSIGFAQSHYEIWAIPAILVLCYVFIPIYRKRNFFTLSQFLEARFNANARLVYTFLMVAFILIQLIGGFYIGSRTLGLLFLGTDWEVSYIAGIFIIAAVTVVFTVFGGMESVVTADNILTIIMIVSILLMGTLTYMQPEIGGLSGLLKLDHAGANKMHLYLPSNHPKLPWSGIFTGLTILNMFYWTTNQYQVQRVLAAKTDKDAKLGAIAAGFLKLIIPFFSIAVGSAAYYIFKNRYGADYIKPDDTFLTLLKTVVPTGYGFVGLILAGLLCAIFSAIYSMMNSVSTMMAYDIFKKYISPKASDKKTVRFGQFSVVIICAIAGVLAFLTYDPKSSDNFFLTLANQTSYIKPGLVVVFFWGVLWKQTNATSAVLVLASSPLIGLGCDWIFENILVQSPFIVETLGESFNFLYRVFSIFVIGSILLVILSKFLNAKGKAKATEFDLGISLSGIGSILITFFLIISPFIALAITGILSPQIAATPASVACFLVFVWFLKKEKEEIAMYKSDIFYAGILTSSMIWIMFYFA